MKKMPLKAVLTKRKSGPDKMSSRQMSKAVLTKRLRDKTTADSNIFRQSA